MALCQLCRTPNRGLNVDVKIDSTPLTSIAGYPGGGVRYRVFPTQKKRPLLLNNYFDTVVYDLWVRSNFDWLPDLFQGISRFTSYLSGASFSKGFYLFLWDPTELAWGPGGRSRRYLPPRPHASSVGPQIRGHSPFDKFAIHVYVGVPETSEN